MKKLIFTCLVAALAAAAADLNRADSIEAARTNKEQTLADPTESKLERVIVRAEHNGVLALLGNTEGFGIVFGDMVPGAGFALGPSYQRSILDGRVHLRTSVEGSAKQFYIARFGATAFAFNNRASFDFLTSHSDYPQIPYYGPGPDSRKTGRSDYRIENTNVEFRPAYKLYKNVLIGAFGGFEAFNVGPGTADRYISTDQQYGPAVTPGINRQTNFLEGGGFLQYDWRDRPGDSTKGGSYRAEYTRFSDRDAAAYSFYRLNLDAQQYIPLFNGKRVLAFHGATSLTDPGKGQAIPFYLQPTLGGPDGLRGFRPYRFNDNNSVLIQGEYRWEASGTLGLALFADGGKVFHNWEQWNLHKIEGSFGFGIRIKTPQKVAFRIDTGFSHEGFQIWIRSANPF